MELIPILLAKGDRQEAERVLADPAVWPDKAEPGSRESLLQAETLVALAAGDRDRAQKRALEVLEITRALGWPNAVAARVWWVGRIFGPELAGGGQGVEEARRTLGAAHWIQNLQEPDLVFSVIAAEPTRRGRSLGPPC